MKSDSRLIFRLLGDTTRLAIVELLIEGKRCVCEIFPKVGRTQSTVSIQLSMLEDAGLLASERIGKKVYYGIIDERVCAVLRAAGNKKALAAPAGCCRKMA